MRQLITLIFLFVTLQPIVAQGIDLPDRNIWPETPQAATLREVTMPPPAYSTGSVTFSVPLYTIETDALDLPLELRYVSNGIHVTDDPYPIGYGWSLLPAFKITRVILGRPDGEGYEFIGESPVQSLTHPMKQRCLVDRYASLKDPEYLFDSEHDIFTFHLPDVSFNAWFEDGVFKTVGHSEYRLQADTGLASITVTDPHGRIWKFATFGAKGNNPTPMEWGLTTVTLPTGKKIEFNWDFGYHGIPNGGNSYKWDHYYPLIKNGYLPESSLNGAHNSSSGFSPEILDLKSITYPGGEVIFSYNGTSLSPTTLKELTVKAGGEIIRKITFKHGTSPSESTMLKEIVFPDDSHYTFTYNSETFSGSEACDYWGYYNNSNGLQTGPGMTIKYNAGEPGIRITGCDRTPDEEKMQARILTKVKYPTGGSVEWEYEAHRFDPVDFIDCPGISNTKDKTLSFGGGLRVVREILRESEEDTDPLIVEYVYGKGGDGKAVVEQHPTASTFLSNTSILAFVGDSNDYAGIGMYGMLSSSPNSSCMSYRFGDPLIWYEEVQEVYPEGKIVHHFSKEDTSEYALAWLNGMKPVSLYNVFNSGILETLTETYGIRNGKETLLEKRETEYVIGDLYPPFQGIIVDRKICQCGLGNIAPDFPEEYYIIINERYDYGDNDIYEAYPYTITPIIWQPGSVTHTEYTENGAITTTETYTYVKGTGLIESVTVTGGGVTTLTEYVYADRFSTSVAKAMKDANIVGEPVGVRRTCGTAVTEEYLEMGRIGSGNLFRPLTYRKSRGGATPYIVRTYSWSADGNLLSHYDADGVKTEYTWDTTTGMYPLTMKVGGKLTTTATWKPFVGVASLKDPSGVTEAYTYDSEFRLTTVKRNNRLMDSFTYSVNDNCTSNVVSREWVSSSTNFYSKSDVDGLGRVVRKTMQYPEGPVSVLTEFDAMGRPVRQWNGAPSSPGSAISSYKSSATSFYSDTRPFTETLYEVSPRNVATAEIGPGEKWRTAGRMVEHERLVNDIPDYSLLHIIPTSTGVTIKEMYPRGSLHVDITTDEDGNEHTVYTDVRGLKLYESIRGAGTYYVYDDYGDLRYILPPGAAPEDKRTSERMRNLCYWYDYDTRGNLITRKLPGVREERYLYDPADRLVAEKSRDLPDGMWRLHIYDGCGRQVLTVNARISDIQASSFADCCRTASLSGTASFAGYSVTPAVGVPSTASCEVGEALYYDDYGFITRLGLGTDFQYKHPVSELGIGARIDASVRGSITKGNSLGRLTGKYTGAGYEAYYYDSMGMELQRCATGYNRGRLTTLYTYSLDPLSVHLTYGGSLPDLDTYYRYDAAGRAKEISHVQRRSVGGVEICDTASTVLSFDKVGRVIAEQSGNVRRELTYDVRSWLRKTETKTLSGSNIFSEKLKYEDGVTPLYSGRLSGYEWRHGTVNALQKYDFTYNRSGNLIKAAYTSGESGADFSTEYTYGLRGELKKLKRNGVIDVHPSGKHTYGLLDDITADYEGNRPVGLTVESDAQVFSSRTGIRGAGEFSMSYDSSGRLLSDTHRGITSIEYDNSGYPISIDFSSGDAYTRVQDSEGRLIRKTLTSQTSSGKTIETVRVYTGGGHILRNDTLEMTLFPGGYFTPDGKVYYYVRDYRGNNAGVAQSTGIGRQIMDYYPYGEPFSEWNWELAGSKYGVSSNRYLFCANERETSFGMNQYDFNARSYLASFPTFTQIDPLCEKYPWLSPYAYCGGDPINRSDPTGEVVETVWDVLNVLYDAGMTIYTFSTGDNEGGKAYLVDLGCDALAVIIPGLPAGASKLAKAGAKGATKAVSKQAAKQGTKQAATQVAETGAKKGTLKNADRIQAGKNHEAETIQKAKDAGLDVKTNIRLVPQNGKGNVMGNRTNTDLLIRNDDGTYTIIETKLTDKTKLTTGQKEAKTYWENCFNKGESARFEVRSDLKGWGLSKGQVITVREYRVVPKEIIK